MDKVYTISPECEWLTRRLGAEATETQLRRLRAPVGQLVASGAIQLRDAQEEAPAPTEQPGEEDTTECPQRARKRSRT